MRRARVVSALCLLLGATACNPFGCVTQARLADFSGRLGHLAPPTDSVAQREPGRVFLGLGQWRGGTSQMVINWSANTWPFSASPSEVRVYDAVGDEWQLLYSSTAGYVVRDSFFVSHNPSLFGGPGNWEQLWNALHAGHGVLEVRFGDGTAPVQAGLKVEQTSGWSDSCT